MTSQFGCLELLITRTFLSGPVKFEITRVDCINPIFQLLSANHIALNNSKPVELELLKIESLPLNIKSVHYTY